jgi:hypothetical protein
MARTRPVPLELQLRIVVSVEVSRSCTVPGLGARNETLPLGFVEGVGDTRPEVRNQLRAARLRQHDAACGPWSCELAALYRAQADVMELISLSQEAIDQSKELITQTDAVLAKSPLKP